MLEFEIRNLLKKLRGELSYNDIDALLSYSKNTYYRLENDYKILTVKEFSFITKILAAPSIKTTTNLCFDIKLEQWNQEEFFTKYFEYWGEIPKYTYESVLGYSKAKWWRLRTGKSNLALIDFLKIIRITNDRLNLFFEAYGIYLKSEEARTNSQPSININSCSNQDAIAHTILCALSLDAYKKAKNLDHSFKILEESTGLSFNKIETSLKILEKSKAITKNNFLYSTQYHKMEYRPNNLSDREGIQNLLNHLVSILKKKINSDDFFIKDSPNLKATCRIAPVNDETFLKIRNLQIEYYHKIHSLIISDENDKNRNKVIGYLNSFFNIAP